MKLRIGILITACLFYGLHFSGDVLAGSVTDQMVSMVTNPYIIPFFLTAGMIGLMIEFLFPGLVFPGMIGLGAFGIYFFGYYVADAGNWDAPALFVTGLILIVLEMVIPNFGVMGVLGFLFLVSSFIMTVSSWVVGLVSLTMGIGLTILFLWILSRYINLQTVWHRFILKDSYQSSQGYISQKDRSYLLGKTGITTTPLQSSGYARFDDQLEDVVSNGRSIPVNVRVVVIAVEGARVVVRQEE